MASLSGVNNLFPQMTTSRMHWDSEPVQTGEQQVRAWQLTLCLVDRAGMSKAAPSGV